MPYVCSKHPHHKGPFYLHTEGGVQVDREGNALGSPDEAEYTCASCLSIVNAGTPNEYECGEEATWQEE